VTGEKRNSYFENLSEDKSSTIKVLSPRKQRLYLIHAPAAAVLYH
jgi:hypothetical protein